MIDEDFDQFENGEGDAPAAATKVVNKTSGRKAPAKKAAAKKTTRRQRSKAQDDAAPAAPERDEDAEKAAYEARVAEAKPSEPASDSDDDHEGKTKVTVKATRPSAVADKSGDHPDIDVEFVTYVEPDVGEWDARVMFLFNQGRDMDALMLLMGVEEVARYLDTIQPKQRDASRLLVEALNDALGLTSGN